MSSERVDIQRSIVDCGALAVVRAKSPELVKHIVAALLKGGLTGIEITMTVPGAIEQIRALSKEFGDEALIGVGSVISEDVARRAVDAGARYVVSPILNGDVINACNELDTVVIPGTFTPSEAQRAHELGADFIKVFPANILGMPYFKSVLAPLPHLQLIPTGGVTPDNAGEWISAGAVAVGVGSALLKKSILQSGRFEELTPLAETLVRNVRNARSPQA